MASGDRQAAIAQRTLLIERLRAMPAAMRERPQWLLWRFEQREGKPKPLKVPYYASGKVRGGVQGSEADRAALVTLDVVLQRLGGGLHWSGAGFAFLPGDGLIGIDVDGAVDPDDGSMSDLCRTVVQVADSYTELSPSGRGVHVIVRGHVDKSFKSNEIGLEVFCGSQFFTCTGAHLADTPREVQAIEPEALAYLQERVDKAKAAAKPEPAPDPESAAAPPPPAPPSPPPRPGQGGDDFRRVNDAALQHLAAWVPAMLPAARVFQGGYRITSKALGRELEEDLQLLPAGIMDFGTEQGMSPIDVVIKWGHQRNAKDALHWLAGQLGLPLTKPQRPKLSVVPPVGEQGGKAAGASPAPPMDGADASGTGGGGEPSSADGPGAGSKAPRKRKIDWDHLAQLFEDFALIYGTDTCFDGRNYLIMKLANMAHAHGSDLVKLWKAGRSCDKRSDGGRWTVMPENVVFDPTEQADPDTHINLFRGFALEPKQGDIGPALELIKHLCSRAGDTPEACDDVLHYLLCWMAWPLQNRGSKLRTAVVMHGDEGAGKNFLFDMLVEIYGEYGACVGQDELEDKFNDWRSRKMLVVGDEVSSRAELVHNKNRLKALITSPTVQINPKNLPRREEANHINVVFLSNELQPLALDNSDRRYLVIFTPKALGFDFYARLGKWKLNGGAAALYHYLLHYECNGFDPFAPAPSTAAKKDLIDLNRKSPERFWLEWEAGEIDLPYRSCSIAQAYQAYLKYAQRTGDRFPVQRSLFTRMVMRVADTYDKPLIDKVMKVDYGPRDGPVSNEKATRMLLVLPPPDEGQGAWATDAWWAFEADLRKYIGRTFGGGTEDTGAP